MTDLASLVLAIDSTQVKAGAKDLDNLAAAGGRAERSTLNISAAQVKAAGGWHAWEAAAVRATKTSGTATGAATQMTKAVTGVGAASGLARHHLQNLTFQVNDVAMALATGQNPMRVFIQQGSQIAQIGQQAGVGVGGLARAVLRLLAPFAGIAAVAGGVLLAFKGVKEGAEAADPKAKAFIATLGLTRDEIKKLEDTSVTWGDIMGATFDVLAERAGTSSEEVKGAWGDAMQFLMDFGKHSVASLLAGFAALVQFAGSAAQDIGVGLAKGIAFGANAGLAAIEAMINGIVDGVNRVSGLFKALGVDFGSLGHVSLGRIEAKGSFTNPLADAASRSQSTYNDVIAGFGAIGSRAGERRDARSQEQAEELISDRTGKAAKAHKAKAEKLSDEAKAALAALKAGQQYLEGLQKETDGIGKNAIETKRMEVAVQAATLRKAAAVAPTQQLRDALLAEAEAVVKAGQDWEKVYGADKLAGWIRDTLEPLERQASLIGLGEEAQARANLEFEKARIIAEYGAAAWERYYATQSKIIADQFKVLSPFEEWAKTIPQTTAEVNAALQTISLKGFDGLASAITDVITGTASLKEAFSDLARSIIADIIQMTIRMLIFRAISGMFGGGGNPAAAINVTPGAGLTPTTFLPPLSAKGNIFSHGNIVPFGLGGIVTGPTFFPMSGGRAGLMGEAGEEAVMPLARDSHGRLGVRANDNAPIEVHVTVSASPELDARIESVSARTVGQAAPVIVKAAVGQTTRALTRPKLMGRG